MGKKGGKNGKKEKKILFTRLPGNRTTFDI